MAKFQFLLFAPDSDRQVAIDYFEETLSLYWVDEVRQGYEVMLDAIQNAQERLGSYVVRFELDDRIAHEIMQNILSDVQELLPYANEPIDNYYYDRQTCILLHIVSMMMNPYRGKGEQ